MTITGPGQELLIVDGNNSTRIFRINHDDPGTAIDVAIQDLILANGSVPTNGAAIVARENLSLTNVTLSGNTALNMAGDRLGGSVYVGLDGTDGLSVSLDNVTVTGNTSTYGGGFAFRLASSTPSSVTIGGLFSAIDEFGVMESGSDRVVGGVTPTCDHAERTGPRNGAAAVPGVCRLRTA